MKRVSSVLALESTARAEMLRSALYGDPFVETVGMIFEFSSLVGVETKEVVFELENVGEPGSFAVDGEEIRLCAEYLVSKYGPGIGDRLLEKALWHSHMKSEEPSPKDIAEFPEWAADRGIVYHAPSAKSCAYSRSGVHSGQGPSTSPVTSQAIEGIDHA